MIFGSRAKTTLPTADEALPGREHRTFTVPTTHEVLGSPLEGPWPDGTEVLYVAMGWVAIVAIVYRSAIYWSTPGQEAAARATKDAFQDVLTRAGRGQITTTLAPASVAGPFWYAEDYHQQYLHKNPNGYCNHGPNGLTCPVGIANLPAQTDVLPPA